MSLTSYQDWGLRNARKTAFHAAVNFYCRQLGITATASDLPVQYTVQENFDVDYLSPMAEGDVDASSEVLREAPASKEKATFLGFQPPPDKLVGVRARKSRSKKALMSSGADGAGGDF